MKEREGNTYRSVAGYGIDVAHLRADDLDKMCLEHVAQKGVPRVLDIGCGLGGQAVRLAQAGALVTAVDIHDFKEVFSNLRKLHGLRDSQLQFVQSDIHSYLSTTTNARFDSVLFQRTLHYLPYTEAKEVLTCLSRLTDDRLYISVTGLGSAVAYRYLGFSEPINERYSLLDPETADTFSITKPVCLYSKDELICMLKESGWGVQSCWESAFGNIKAIANADKR